jgi:hypothetical protein
MKKYLFLSTWWPMLLWGTDRFEIVGVEYIACEDEWAVTIEDNDHHDQYFYRMDSANLWNNDIYDIIIWNVPERAKYRDFVDELDSNHE